jgi:penicillin V acylase-like amidase (Ntn superfamily)
MKFLLALVGSATACSNWLMPHDTGLSGRTTDLGSSPGLSFEMRTLARGSKTLGTKLLPGGVNPYGFLGIVPVEFNQSVAPMVTAGINEKGLTCDMQTLITTKMPPPLNSSADLFVELFCEWALGGFESVDDVHAALLNASRVHVYGDALESGANGQHYSLRDSTGRSIVVEWVGGSQQVYWDLDDKGKTGWGIMTNEPEYPWMVRMVQHFEWKQSLARPSTSIPGAFYPDERFLRIHIARRGLPQPSDYQDALSQAVHVLNTVTVPVGALKGTDSGPGEGQGDHTLWAVIYDHRNASIYFRHEQNQNLQRVRLADLHLEKGAPSVSLPISRKNALPYFGDATSSFKPK